MFRALQKRNFGSERQTPLAFQHEAARSTDLVKRIELRAELNGHRGCVNTVSFNEGGDLLVSGSDDKRIIVWNWYTGARTLTYKSGHHNNIFQARFLPHSNDSTVVSCAADGQVRIGYLRSEGGKVKTYILGHHGRRAHKLALDPQSPTCFYSCGEDGRVFHYDLKCKNARQSLLVCTKSCSEGHGERLQLHSIHCNPLRPWQFAVGGSDIFVRIYDQRRSLSTVPSTSPQLGLGMTSAAALADPLRKLAPRALRQALSRFSMVANVTCANFSRKGEIVATYNDENIYLFKSEGPTVPPPLPPPAELPCLRRRVRKRAPPPQAPAGTSHLRRQALAERHPEVQTGRSNVSPSGGNAEELRAQASGSARIAEMQEPAQNTHTVRAGEATGSRRANTSRLSREHSEGSPSSPAIPPCQPASSGPCQPVEGERDPADQASNWIGGAPFERRRAQGVAAALSHELELACAQLQGNLQPVEASVTPSRSARGVTAEALTALEAPEEAGMADINSDTSTCSSSAEESHSNSENEIRGAMGDIISLGSTGDSEDDPELSASLENDIDVDSLLQETSDDEDDVRNMVGAVVMTSANREAFLGEQAEEEAGAMEDEVMMEYSGHRNFRTIKGVSFLGESDDYVMSGSDDGHIYIWGTYDGVLRQWLPGDAHVVNCLEPHPTQPLAFATSGIEDNIKLWTPTAPEPRPIPEEAMKYQRRNGTRQGSHRVPMVTSARRILLRLQQLAELRDSELPHAPQSSVSHESGETDGEGAADNRSRNALNAHRSVREALEDEMAYEYDDPRGGCVIS